MALMTPQEYIDSLRKLNTRVYMFGENIENWVDHPMIRPSINCVAMTYALAQDPQYADLMTVKSSLTGHTINRFTHLHQSTEDATPAGSEDRFLLPALRGHGLLQRGVLHHLRGGREVRHPLS